MRAQFVFQEIWIGLRRNLTMTISLVITVAIAMALFGTGLLIRSQVDSSKSYWYDRIEVSVFLCAKTSSTPSCSRRDVTDQQKQVIEGQLKKLPQVAKRRVREQGAGVQALQGALLRLPGLRGEHPAG